MGPISTDQLIEAAGILAIIVVMIVAGGAMVANELRRRDEGDGR